MSDKPYSWMVQIKVVADPKATFSVTSIKVPAKRSASFTVSIKPPTGLPGILF